MEVEQDKIRQDILASARLEFTKFSYRGASVRRICQQAGVTTGALYKRFKGKEDLFFALIQPTLDTFATVAAEKKEEYDRLLAEDELYKLRGYNIEDTRAAMELFFNHKEDMQLLLFKSEGTSRMNFQKETTRYDVEETYGYLLKAHQAGKTKYLLEKKYLESALETYYTAFFKPLAQDWTKEEAMKYCDYLTMLFDWPKFFGLIEEERNG
ncbi:TetR/AcrR family transcriptional regulator [Streptococcus oricebi]|uniref:TetR/AcrR family transcriptional regulator n=1 Tax=Streptococcus oricebi TaxID=1547447 RepID=A0ABS5B2N8_9STRE|nr:TetR/AcrR family transcriptional regulator [Streptococcus oricebi]MBP2623085.1 TetR/AcrR family transcriptional regulator [Streptococcus oricebi]